MKVKVESLSQLEDLCCVRYQQAFSYGEITRDHRVSPLKPMNGESIKSVTWGFCAGQEENIKLFQKYFLKVDFYAKCKSGWYDTLAWTAEVWIDPSLVS